MEFCEWARVCTTSSRVTRCPRGEESASSLAQRCGKMREADATHYKCINVLPARRGRGEAATAATAAWPSAAAAIYDRSVKFWLTRIRFSGPPRARARIIVKNWPHGDPRPSFNEHAVQGAALRSARYQESTRNYRSVWTSSCCDRSRRNTRFREPTLTSLVSLAIWIVSPSAILCSQRLIGVWYYSDKSCNIYILNIFLAYHDLTNCSFMHKVTISS